MAGARTWSLDTLAQAAGRAPSTLRLALTSARQYEAETGAWPTGSIPRPDTDGPHPSWRQARRDVKRWVQDRQDRAPHPQLLDRDWLDHQYTAGGATPLGRSAESIARELAVPRSTVINYLESHRIPIRPSGHATKLAGLTLADFEADLQAYGTQAKAAAARQVTYPTWLRAWRRLQAGQEPPEATQAREKAATEAATLKAVARAEAAGRARGEAVAAARERIVGPRREQAAMAARVLDRGYRLGVSGERNPLTSHARLVLETRVAYPEASMVELADLAGVAGGVRISRGGFSSTLNALLGWQNPEVSEEGKPIPDRA